MPALTTAPLQVAYLPVYKVAPEWPPIFEPLSASVQSRKRRTLRRRRRLLQDWSAGADTGTALDTLLVQQVPGLAPHAAIWVSFPPGLVNPPSLLQKTQRRGLARWRRRSEPKPPSPNPAPTIPQAAAQEWATPLQQLLASSGPSCVPMLVPSTRGLQVLVCPEDLEVAVQWLAQQSLVHFVSPVTRASSSNLYANIITQVSRGGGTCFLYQLKP